jgi:hypothetical protein
MSAEKIKNLVIVAATVALAASVSKIAFGSAQLEQIGSLSNNEGIVVDVATFKVARGGVERSSGPDCHVECQADSGRRDPVPIGGQALHYGREARRRTANDAW